jgi:hypothetical protein
MPTLARLQRAAALVHWAGRHRAGLAPPGRLEEQARRLLDLDRWLDGHGPAVVAAALRARPAPGPERSAHPPRKTSGPEANTPSGW